MLVCALRMQAKEAPEIVFAEKHLGKGDEGDVCRNEKDSIT